MVLDFFQTKKYLNYFKKNEFLIPSSVNFPDYLEFFDTELFQTRNNLINENIRLKNEVLELRKLKIENDLLKEN